MKTELDAIMTELQGHGLNVHWVAVRTRIPEGRVNVLLHHLYCEGLLDIDEDGAYYIP